jgi:hypothetical protein
MSADEIRASYVLDRVSVDWAMSALDTRTFTALDRAAFAYAHSVADQLHEALAHQGFPRLRVKRAIKALGDRLETDKLEDLRRDALAILARRPVASREPPEGEQG